MIGIEPKPAPNESLCNETWGPQLARGSAGEARLYGDMPVTGAMASGGGVLAGAIAGGGVPSPGGMRVTW